MVNYLSLTFHLGDHTVKNTVITDNDHVERSRKLQTPS